MPTRQVPARGIEDQPGEEYFDVMAHVAETHWWYRARRAWLRQMLADRLPNGSIAIDIGTGTAESLAVLESLGACAAVGTDLSPHALHHVIRRGGTPRVLQSLAERLPFKDRAGGCLISMDVIEHLDDDILALREYRRVLLPGGVLFLTVPAYQWLWSEHDDWAAHRRRYTARRLEDAVRTAGFEVEKVSYYFSFLLPPAILVRRTPLRHLIKESNDELTIMHPAIEATFAGLARAERWIGGHVRVPFGLSVLVVARVPNDGADALP